MSLMEYETSCQFDAMCSYKSISQDKMIMVLYLQLFIKAFPFIIPHLPTYSSSDEQQADTVTHRLMKLLGFSYF